MNYIKIDNCNMNNGNGLRTVIWLSGCKHHCENCFNKETWSFRVGGKVDNEVIDFLCKCISHTWCSGLTLSGGDPTSQNVEGLKTLIELCEYTHSINKNVWIWSGYTWEEIFSQDNTDEQGQYRMELIRNCDILVDGKYVDAERDLTLKWRGSKNQRVIDVQKSLNEKRVVLIEDE